MLITLHFLNCNSVISKDSICTLLAKLQNHYFDTFLYTISVRAEFLHENSKNVSLPKKETFLPFFIPSAISLLPL